MSDFDPTDLVSAEPANFAAKVKAASKDQLAAAMGGEHRAGILDSVFRQFPGRFRADRAGSTNVVIHWVIGGRSDGGSDTYELAIAGGTCTVSPAPKAEPRVSLTIGGVEFLQLISGAANPMTQFMTGKLKVKGDVGLAANLQNLFDLAH